MALEYTWHVLAHIRRLCQGACVKFGDFLQLKPLGDERIRLVNSQPVSYTHLRAHETSAHL
eukprot:6019322-Alexandrium_andersonii.AAC.1